MLNEGTDGTVDDDQPVDSNERGDRPGALTEGTGPQAPAPRLKVLIAGSHGMVGTALMERLQDDGHQVVRLVRSRPTGSDILWRPDDGTVDTEALEGFDAVVNLAGAPLGERRWSQKEKKKIWDSRVVSTQNLCHRLADTVARPRVVVCASAIGYYGDRGDDPLTEAAEKGEGFLADLCHMWEDASTPASDAGIRVVNLRTGIVLDPRGGALKQQVPLFKLLMGGRLGSGKQVMSWISLRDEVSAIVHTIATEALSGPVNLVAPQTLRNSAYTIALSLTLNRPAFVPAPRWMLKVAFGAELADEMLLASQNVVPERLLATGFEFEDDDINDALERMLQKAPTDPEAEEQEMQQPADKKRRRRVKR